LALTALPHDRDPDRRLADRPRRHRVLQERRPARSVVQAVVRAAADREAGWRARV